MACPARTCRHILPQFLDEHGARDAHKGVGVRGRRLFRAAVRWTVRGAAGLLVSLIALASAGAIYQHFATESDATRFRPNGRMVGIEGRQARIHCLGRGPPTVILEPGLGLPSLVWAWVQPELAGAARVCIYDRAGYGWSDPSDAPGDAANTSRRLYALLNAAGIPGPYVLAGHSIGGAYVRRFAAEHPQAVAALVLIDASSAVGVDWSKFPKPSTLWTAAAPYFATLGGVRALLALGLANFWRDLPPEEGAAVKALISSPKHIEAAVKERDSVFDTLKQTSTLGNLGSLPLAVIYSEQVARPDPHARGMDASKAATLAETIEKQKRAWLDSSTNSRFLTIPESDHISVLTKKEHARALAHAIMDTVETLKR